MSDMGSLVNEALWAAKYALSQEKYDQRKADLLSAIAALVAERDELKRSVQIEISVRVAACAARDRAEVGLASYKLDAERLKRTAIAYQDAYRIARAATYQSHSGHWDSKGTHGANCPECIRASEVRENCDAVLKDALSDFADAALQSDSKP